MKIYYDNQTQNIVIENDDRFFSGGTLEAVNEGDNVIVRYKNTGINNIYIDFNEVQDINGDSSGNSVQEVLDYLNAEFDRNKLVEGQGAFNGLNPTVNITDNSLSDGDLIYITPTINVINEIYFPTIVTNNSFTVNRIVINALNGLTINLPFRWRKLR